MNNNATNHTQYFGFPLFTGTDKPSVLTDWNGTMEELDNTLEDYRVRISGCEQTTQSFMDRLNVVIGQLNDLVARIQGDENIIEQVGLDIEAVNDALLETNASVKRALEELGDLRTTVTGQGSDISALQTQTQANTSNISTLQNTVSGIQGSLATINDSLTALSTRVSTTENDITSLKGRMTQAETDISNLESEIDVKSSKAIKRMLLLYGNSPVKAYSGVTDNYVNAQIPEADSDRYTSMSLALDPDGQMRSNPNQPALFGDIAFTKSISTVPNAFKAMLANIKVYDVVADVKYKKLIDGSYQFVVPVVGDEVGFWVEMVYGHKQGSVFTPIGTFSQSAKGNAVIKEVTENVGNDTIKIAGNSMTEAINYLNKAINLTHFPNFDEDTFYQASGAGQINYVRINIALTAPSSYIPDNNIIDLSANNDVARIGVSYDAYPSELFTRG